ncbi:hypothetical protein T11_10171 [Trichinella zimbabwensis]|uniref:Uncharacterized protein n=1 Tax=Trichinella zimbabwensis TaxID=268475 RepID=A0A0V1H498_9BILA|nr:hypothetical protein T11_10171 [Trichinella zimbabwensis]
MTELGAKDNEFEILRRCVFTFVYVVSKQTYVSDQTYIRQQKFTDEKLSAAVFHMLMSTTTTTTTKSTCVERQDVHNCA